MTDRDKIKHIKQGKPFSLLDIVAICLSLVLCGGLILYQFTKSGKATTVIITQSAQSITTEYPLDTNREIVVDTHKGELVVAIKDGKVFVKSSPCSGQDCVDYGSIKYVGQRIVCADTRVSIRIAGGNTDGLVATT